MKKTVRITLIVLTVLVLIAAPACMLMRRSERLSFNEKALLNSAEPQVLISEYMPKNHCTLADESGCFCDWVELENRSDFEADLSGWTLSDREDGDGWSFGELTLAPGQLLLVFLGGDEALPLHTDFSLSAGETLYLRSAHGQDVCSVVCPDGDADTAYIVSADGDSAAVRYATPGFPNSSSGYDAFCESLECFSPLVINEVMTANLSYYSPYPTVVCDWVELKNVSSSDILLSDYYLSDDDDDYMLWRLPEKILPAGEYMIIYCSGDAESTYGENYHSNFSLDATDEQLFLSGADGEVADFIHLHELAADCSMGRIDGESGFFYMAEATPGSANSTGLRRISAMPEAVSDDGVFNGISQKSVELSGNGDIYYTLDGSLPNTSSALYADEIMVDKTTIVRAIAVEDGAYPSKALTLSYIINENHTLPVLSLVVDNEASFDSMFEVGQKDVYLQSNLALYEEGCRFNSPCAVTMKGWTSLTMYKKSIGVCFKGLYGADDLDCDIFGNGITQYSSLSIRAGQDYNKAIFRNELFQALCLEMSDNVLTQQSKYCIMYVNGRYWGIYSLKEDLSRQYYASNAAVSKDSVEVQKAPARRSSPFFTELITYTLVSDPESDEYYQTMCQRLDMDSLIDWFIIEGYSANVDIRGNVRFFRSSESDNRWQFAFYDLDWSFYHPGSCYVNIFERIGKAGYEMPTLINHLIENPTFRDRFLTRYSQVIKSTLSNEHVLQKIDEFQALLEPEVARDRERWDLPLGDWYYYVDQLRAFVTNNDLDSKTIETMRVYLNVSDDEMIKYFGN